jgi:autotransporter-associated beta strand protein
MTTKWAMAFGVFLFVFTVQAANNRIWDGGGSDANWSTVANWDGDLTAPFASDALFFGGSTRLSNTNDLSAGIAFAGLSFLNGSGAFILGGNAVTLDGNISNLSTSAQTINLPMVLSGIRTISSPNANVTLNGVLSGPGGLIASATNRTVKLTADNTYEGFTTVSNGCRLEITHGNALGSPLAGTLVDGTTSGSLRFSGSIESAEPITLKFRLPNYAASLYSGPGTNIISGLISKRDETRLAVESGANALILAGGLKHVAGGGSCVFYTYDGTLLVVTNKPIEFGTSAALATENPGTVVFAVGGNTLTGLQLRYSNRVRMEVANAFSSSPELRLGIDWATGGAIFDMNGFDQTFGSLVGQIPNSSPGYLAVTSAAPATLTVNQSINTTFPAALAGAVRLVKNGSGTLTFTNAISTTTGELVINAGTLAVAETGGFGATKRIRVNGGTLELRNGTSLPDTTVLLVADGAKVSLKSGVSETIGRFYLNGEPQPSGTWGATDSGAEHINDVFFSGGGVVNVAAGPTGSTTALWDGGGADPNISTAANWSGDVLPGFEGYTTATFAEGGATAVVDTAVGFNRMIFNADTNFTVAAGAGVITNGFKGIVAAVPNTTSRTYRIDEDVVFADHQLWSITNNGAGITTLNVTGALSDNDTPCDLTFQGNGVLRLAGGNTYRGKTSISSNSYAVIAHGNALGSTSGATEVKDGAYLRIDGGSGITVSEPITIAGDGFPGCSWYGALRSNTGSNIWSGHITANGGRLRAEVGSPLEVTGGVDGSYVICSAMVNAWIRFSEKPITATSVTCHTGGGGVIFAVAGNTMSSMVAGGDFIRFDVPNAFSKTIKLTQGSSGGDDSVLNLNGNDQTVGFFETGSTVAVKRVMFSTAPATLTVDQSGNSVHDGNITGAVSIVKLGTGTLLFTGMHTTSGAFSVSNGVLAVGAAGTFGPNSTNIVVGGSGTLLLSNSVAIADSALVTLPASGVSTAKINLAAAVTESVGWLCYGDKIQCAGSYGSTSSTALFKDDSHFAGSGVLTVLHDNSGTVIKLR